MFLSLFGLAYVASVGNFIVAVFFLIQLFIYVFIGGFLTCKRLSDMNTAKTEESMIQGGA